VFSLRYGLNLKLNINWQKNRIKENVMGGTNGTHGGDKKRVPIFWLVSLKVRDHVEDLSVDGREILKMDHRKICLDAVDLIRLAQDRNRWRAVLTVTNLRVP
jgi:hypothetical protein